MNTLLLIGGTSGTGKSTRVYALVKFFEYIGKKPTDYLVYKTKTIGRVYDNVAIIGKEINRQGKTAWQGLDTFSKEFGSSDIIFKYLYNETLAHHVVADSAALWSSYRSRPIEIDKQNLPILSTAKFFSYDSLEEYQARIAGRSGGKLVVKKTMWSSNKRFQNFGENYKEELTQTQHPERYQFIKSKCNEPVSTVGELILTFSGQEALIPQFKEFCEKVFVVDPFKVVSSAPEELW